MLLGIFLFSDKTQDIQKVNTDETAHVCVCVMCVCYVCVCVCVMCVFALRFLFILFILFKYIMYVCCFSYNDQLCHITCI